MFVDPLGQKCDPERLAHQDRQLVGRVVAVDVGARIRFREAQFLGLGERLFEAPAFGQAAEQIVAGAVHHAFD